jgi:DNA polymerase III epsilon subunit-like protein
MTPIKHLMVDIETLSHQPDAAIIAIGAVTFTEDEILSQFEMQIDPVWTHGHRSVSTMEWWNKQDEQVRSRMFRGKQLPGDVCRRFSNFIELNQPKYVWANAPTFDLVILRNYFRECRLEFPISFRMERCFRTLKAMADEVFDGTLPYPSNSFGKHDALSDAMYQANTTQIILKVIRGSRPELTR